MATSKGRSRGQHQTPTVEDWLESIRPRPPEYNPATDCTIDEAASFWGCSREAARIQLQRNHAYSVRVWHVQKEKLIRVYRQPAVSQPPAPPLPEVPAGDDDGDQRRARQGVRRVSSKGRK